MLKFLEKYKYFVFSLFSFSPFNKSCLLLSQNKLKSNDCLICVCENVNNFMRENNI